MGAEHSTTLVRPDYTFGDLHRQGEIDRARHIEKVKRAMQANMGQFISSTDNFITTDPNSPRQVLVPQKLLELPRFRFAPPDISKEAQLGIGKGGSKKGDVIGKVPKERQNPKVQGQPGQGGSEPGMDEFSPYPIEITQMEMMRWLLGDDFCLPHLRQKSRGNTSADSYRYEPVHRKQTSNLDVRRTLKAAVKRQQMEGKGGKDIQIKEGDLWVLRAEDERRPNSNAAVHLIADRSGSINNDMLNMQRMFGWFVVQSLRQIYPDVKIEFVTYHTEATRRQNEQEFFTLSSSGGTKISSALELTRNIIDTEYAPSDWNNYVYLLSDGENAYKDNEACIPIIKDILERQDINQLAYVETVPGRDYNSSLYTSMNTSGLGATYEGIFKMYRLNDMEAVKAAMRNLFTEQEDKFYHPSLP